MFDMYSPITKKLLLLSIMSGGKVVLDGFSQFKYTPNYSSIVSVDEFAGLGYMNNGSYKIAKITGFQTVGTNKVDESKYTLNKEPKTTGWATVTGKVGLVDNIAIRGASSVIISRTDPSTTYGITYVRTKTDGTKYDKQTTTDNPATITPDTDDLYLLLGLYRVDGTNMTIAEAQAIELNINVNNANDYKDFTSNTVSIPNIGTITSGHTAGTAKNYVKYTEDNKWQNVRQIDNKTLNTLTWTARSHVRLHDEKVVWTTTINNIKSDTENVIGHYPLGEVSYSETAVCKIMGDMLVVFDPDYPVSTDHDDFVASLSGKTIYYEKNTSITYDVTSYVYNIDYYDASDTIVEYINPSITLNKNSSYTQEQEYQELTIRDTIINGYTGSSSSDWNKVKLTDRTRTFCHYFPIGRSTVKINMDESPYISRWNADGVVHSVNTATDTYTFNFSKGTLVYFTFKNTNDNTLFTNLNVVVSQPYVWYLNSKYRNVPAESINWKFSEGPTEVHNNALYYALVPDKKINSIDMYIQNFTTSPYKDNVSKQTREYGADIDDLLFIPNSSSTKINAISSRATLAEFKEYLTGKNFHYEMAERADVLDVTEKHDLLRAIPCEAGSTIKAIAGTIDKDVYYKVSIKKV